MLPFKAPNAILVVGTLGFASWYVLFTVTPVLSYNLAGSIGAGLSTTVFMAFTIVAQICTPFALKRYRPHLILGLALLLLGIPSLVYLGQPNLTMILTAAALRGIGFGLITIISTALVTIYAATGREGAALGLYGLSTSLTGIVAPAGLILLDWSHPAPAILAFVMPCSALVLLGVIHRASPTPITAALSHTEEQHPLGSLRPMLLTLAIFIPAAVVYGSMYTFIPLATSSAALALLLFGLGFAIGRLAGGRLVDRWPARAVLAPSVFVAVAGMLGLAMLLDSGLIWLTVIPLGLAIGSIASSSLTGLMKAANPRDYGLVSTAWNLSFDLGIAIGGLGVALLVGASGFTGAFLVLSGLLAVALILGLIGLRREMMTP